MPARTRGRRFRGRGGGRGGAEGEGRRAGGERGDAFDRVLLHGEEEARGHLRARRPRVEHRRRRVREVLLRHERVRLDRRVDVVLVDAERHAHQHVLRPLGDLAVHAQQVRLLERLEAEVVVLEVAVVHDRRVEAVAVLGDDLVHVVRHERRVLPGARVLVLVERVHHGGEALVGHLVQVGDGDARGEPRVVGVLRRQVRGGLGGKVVERGRRHAVVHALDHLHRDHLRRGRVIEVSRRGSGVRRSARRHGVTAPADMAWVCSIAITCGSMWFGSKP